MKRHDPGVWYGVLNQKRSTLVLGMRGVQLFFFLSQRRRTSPSICNAKVVRACRLLRRPCTSALRRPCCPSRRWSAPWTRWGLGWHSTEKNDAEICCFRSLVFNTDTENSRLFSVSFTYRKTSDLPTLSIFSSWVIDQRESPYARMCKARDLHNSAPFTISAPKTSYPGWRSPVLRSHSVRPRPQSWAQPRILTIEGATKQSLGG